LDEFGGSTTAETSVVETFEPTGRTVEPRAVEPTGRNFEPRTAD
jgi:hypothetical protein